MKRLFTFFNCIIVIIAFFIGMRFSAYEQKFGILTVATPKIPQNTTVLKPNPENGKVNINKASKEELQTLHGIGEKLSERIMEYRQNQEFKIIEDIMKVSGVGESLFSEIKEKICVY